MAKIGYVSSSFDYLHFGDFFSAEENELRLKIRDLLQKEVVPTIGDFIEKAMFPEPYLAKFREAGIIGHFINKPYGFGSSMKV